MSKQFPDDCTGADFGTVPGGWTRDSWVQHLRGLVVACAGIREDRADYYRRWIAIIETNSDLNEGD